MSAPTDAQRREVAREYARWHFGYRVWADEVIGAYNDPESALKRLVEAQGEDGPAGSLLAEIIGSERAGG